MQVANLDIDAGRLAEICERYGIAELSVFGSFATGNADRRRAHLLREGHRYGGELGHQ